MGEVYRAQDTRLRREVAVKVSGDQFTERFEREARLIASLNHPNICTLHDVGPNYLVMELIEGPTLAERISSGAIPWDESLGIALQVVAALEAAHEKGIVHRDLKPGNIKIKPEGTVKVLDFGLAKAGGVAMAQPSEDSPTLSMAATEAGVILGTGAYMSPEQAKGKPVDKRADIWAFGVVLYEMLTAVRPFRGESISETLASVLKEEPEWDLVPAKARRLIKTCLRKDPKQRLHDISDAKLLLEDQPADAAVPVLPQRSARRGLWRRFASWRALARLDALPGKATRSPRANAVSDSAARRQRCDRTFARRPAPGLFGGGFERAHSSVGPRDGSARAAPAGWHGRHHHALLLVSGQPVSRVSNGRQT